MKQRCEQGNSNCIHFIPNDSVGFKVVTPKKGDHYNGHKYDNHSLVFLLEGETEFSYNDFLHRRFVQGDLFFIPQAAEMYGTSLTDAKMLVLSFNNRIETLCDRCRLSQGENFISEINYDFKPLKITDTLYTFTKLMTKYIEQNIKCRFLHELKQLELFVILGSEFAEKDLVELFYPIAGGHIDFKARIMENYRHGLDVKELAERFGMSYKTFLRRFKKEFGESIQEWMLKQKAKHIKVRLSIPSTTIQTIINDFEFTDSSHFVRFCRKQYGCTPTELVKQVKNNNPAQ